MRCVGVYHRKSKAKHFLVVVQHLLTMALIQLFFFCRHNEDKLTFVWLKDWRQMRQTVGKDEGDERDNLKSNN